MPSKGLKKIGREEIVAAIRKFAEGRGETVTQNDFCRHMGISPASLLKRWGRWSDLRRDAGLKRARAKAPVYFSDGFLIREYRRVCIELGHPPSESEFDQRAACSRVTLQKRFGTMEAVRRRARILDDAIGVFGGRDVFLDTKPKLAWDVEWLGELWKRVRPGFALYSSDLMEVQPFEYDVVFCAVHDWPVCPVAVLVATDVLGERAREERVEELRVERREARGERSEVRESGVRGCRGG